MAANAQSAPSRFEVGLLIEGQEGVSWPQWRQLAAISEEHGFDGLYSSDHYLSEHDPPDRGGFDAWGTICALAAVTSRIRLGTIVSPVTFRHPSTLAKLVVTASHISGGRIDVALGTGWFEPEHLAYGFQFPPPRERTEMLAEQAEIISRSWSDERFSFAGKHYRIDELGALPKPLKQPRLILGGFGGPRSLAIAARWADEYNSPMPTDEEIRARRQGFAEALRKERGEAAAARFSIVASVLVAADEQALSERLPEAPADDWIIGTPGRVVERLHSLRQMGVDRVILQPVPHADLDSIALIGREVLPLLDGRS